MDERPSSGEKRTFAQTFGDDEGESRTKKARTDSLDSVAAAADAMEVDSLPRSHVPSEGESSRRLKALEERELALNRDLMLLKNGQLPLLADGYKRIEKERVEKLQSCENWKLHQLRQIEIESDARKRQAEDEFANDQREARDKLISVIKEEKHRIEKDFADNEKSVPQHLATKKQKPRGPKPPEPARSESLMELEKSMSLADKEVRDDFAQIQKNIQQPPST